jgi:hypothetical protein
VAVVVLVVLLRVLLLLLHLLLLTPALHQRQQHSKEKLSSACQGTELLAMTSLCKTCLVSACFEKVFMQKAVNEIKAAAYTPLLLVWGALAY